MPRVVEFDRLGGPEVLVIRDRAVPAPGPDEVRIRVRAIGLNRTDMMWREGTVNVPVSLPGHLGYEAAGTVEAVGTNVSHIAVGDAVNSIPAFSMNDYATYGELVLVPAAFVVPQPAGLTFEEGASIWMMFLTAYGALVESAGVKPGDFVVVTAASSSVALAAMQLARQAGAQVIALTRTVAKREALLAAGAHYVVVTEEQDIAAEITAITEGQGSSIVFDAVGGKNFAGLVSSIGFGGRIYLYGMLANEPTVLPVPDMVGRVPVIHGHTVWTTCADPARLAGAVAAISEGLAEGVLRPVIDRVFAFDDIIAAHRYLESNAQFGKSVVRVDA